MKDRKRKANLSHKPIKGHLQLYNTNRISCCFMGFSPDVSLLSMSMFGRLISCGWFNLDRAMYIFTRLHQLNDREYPFSIFYQHVDRNSVLCFPALAIILL